ncbi:MAG: Omp28-related outer membrane protein [Alloprevotella sp.]|nr:Omp28-related outer membrane protein [Alloprevotella sp.]MBR1652122.1 Omp28-related outer membrane protein [Alloprevotella sp.]
MRHSYALFIFSVGMTMLALTASAQSYVGYTDGTRGAGYKFGSQKEQGLAMYISAEKAQTLKGCRVLGVRTVFRALQNRGASIFLTDNLEAAPAYSAPIENASNEWTDYLFEEPYVVDGSEFYAGFLFNLASTRSTPLGFDGATDCNDGTFWAIQDDEWRDASGIGIGAANIQLVLDQRPATTDLVNKRLEANGVYKVGKAYTFRGDVYNMGTDTIRELTIVTRVGEGEESSVTRKNLQILPGHSYTYTTSSYTLDTEGQQELSITVLPEGKTDADLSDNTSRYTLGVLSGSVKRKILVEGFTTQGCGNCPAGHETLHRVLEKSPDDFVIVNHHSAFGVDRFTTMEDYQWTWFFGSNGGTYAPAVMFNRTPVSGNDVAVFPTTDYNMCLAAANQMLASDAPLQIDMTNEFDAESGRGTVTITIETFATPSKGQHALNVFITQDSIEGIQIDYDNGNQRNYVHNDVFRQTLTSYYGEEISLVPGEKVTKSYPYILGETTQSTYGNTTYGANTVPTDFKNMHLVAFVGDYDQNDPANCPVFNAASVPVLYDPTGINGVSTVGGQSSVAYDLQGRRITKAASTHGISIVNGKKVLR